MDAGGVCVATPVEHLRSGVSALLLRSLITRMPSHPVMEIRRLIAASLRGSRADDEAYTQSEPPLMSFEYSRWIRGLSRGTAEEKGV